MKKGSVFIMSAILAVTLGSFSSHAAEVVSPVAFVTSANAAIKKAAEEPGATTESISTVIEKYFDYEEMGRRALGTTYNTVNESNRKLYFKFFTNLNRAKLQPSLVERSKLQTTYARPGDAKTVSTTVTTNKGKISVVYKLYYTNTNELRIYDVITGGVSYIETTKNQFATITGREGFEGLLRRMNTLGY